MIVNSLEGVKSSPDCSTIASNRRPRLGRSASSPATSAERARRSLNSSDFWARARARLRNSSSTRWLTLDRSRR